MSTGKRDRQMPSLLEPGGHLYMVTLLCVVGWHLGPGQLWPSLGTRKGSPERLCLSQVVWCPYTPIANLHLHKNTEEVNTVPILEMVKLTLRGGVTRSKPFVSVWVFEAPDCIHSIKPLCQEIKACYQQLGWSVGIWLMGDSRLREQ